MSQFNNRNLAKKIENLQKEISNSSSLWDAEDSEKEQQDIRRVKQSWRHKQNRKFKQVQKKHQENKSIKKVIVVLIGVATIPVILTTIPSVWQSISLKIAEYSTPENKIDSGELVTTPCPQYTTEQCQKTIEVVNDEPKTIGDELINSLDAVRDYNQELNKAIKLSDGEDVNLEDK